MTHVCASDLTTIGSYNGLPPSRGQTIIWTGAGILIGPLGANCNEILSQIWKSSFKKMHMKLSSAKWRSFCLGLNVLIHIYLNCSNLVSRGLFVWPRGNFLKINPSCHPISSVQSCATLQPSTAKWTIARHRYSDPRYMYHIMDCRDTMPWWINFRCSDSTGSWKPSYRRQWAKYPTNIMAATDLALQGVIHRLLSYWPSLSRIFQ